MFNQELANKIDSFLRKNLDIMFDFEFNGLLLLRGGAIKGFIMDTKIKDYDFVLLTQEKDNIMDFINTHNVEFLGKDSREYKFTYNNLKIGINPTNDLSYIASLNIDFLFYDVHRKQFIPIGISKALKKRKIIVYGYFGFPRYEQRVALKNRIKVGQEFVQFLTKSNKKVKVVRKNKYYKRLLIGFLKNPSKIKKLFRGKNNV